MPAVPTTLAKVDSSRSHKGKSHPGSSGKKTGPPKQVTKYWGDPERDLEDAKACKRKEEKCRKKKPSSPMLSLDEQEESITVLTLKAVQARYPRHPDRLPVLLPITRGPRARSNRPAPFPSISDKGGEPESKSRKKDHSGPDLMIVYDDDDPLPGKPKGTGKKEKSCMYTQEELGSLDTLLLQLKSKAPSIQYSLEAPGLTKYRNDHVQGLKGAPNTDDHSAYLSDVKKESWSYPAKGNLITVQQFIKELAGCKDAEKRCLVDKTLRDRGMPGIPQDSTPKGGKRELIKARYVMWVLRSIEGEVIDAKHPNYGRELDDWVV